MHTIKLHSGARCEPGRLPSKLLPTNDACAICRDARTVPAHLGTIYGVTLDAIRERGDPAAEVALQNVIRIAAEFGWAMGSTYTLAESTRRKELFPLCATHLALMRGLVAKRSLEETAQQRTAKKGAAH